MPVRVNYCLILLLSLSALFADEVRVEPLEYWQNGSSWPESLSAEQIMESSLVASGVMEADIPFYKGQFEEILVTFRLEFLSKAADLTEREKGEALLEWMHGELLTGRYRTDQTRMDVLLDRGDYNCVSSAVLYLILSRTAGMDTKGEETADHAFCTLVTEGGVSVDVETTTLLGFDPGTRKEFSRDFSGRTGFAYVEPGDYRRRKPASDKKMISLIMQNRIALYQRKGEYDKAVGPTVDRWFFLPDEQNRKDMNDAFRNYVSTLNERGRFQEALDFLLPLSRELDLVDENRDLISLLVLNHVITQINRNSLAEAEAYLDQWADWLDGSAKNEQQRIINDKRAQSAVDSLDYSEALVVIRRMRAEGDLGSARADELLTWLHQNRAMSLMEVKGTDRANSYREVIIFFDSLPAGERSLPGIVDHREKYRHNWAVLIHNRFAELMNDRQFDRAGELLDNALAIEGDMPLLLEDRAFLENHAP